VSEIRIAIRKPIHEGRNEMPNCLICLYWFLVIAGGGYLAFSFVVGGLVDFGEDAIGGLSDAAGHALENIGDAIGGIFGGAEAADAGGIELPDVSGTEFHVDTGPSLFSFRTLVMFATGFGAGGLVGSGLGLSEALTLIPAFGFGAVSGTITWLFLRFLYKDQGTTSIQPADYVGLIGRVTISILEDKLGTVALEVKLQKKLLPARSEDGSPIPAQTQVYVVSMEGGTLIVRKLE